MFDHYEIDWQAFSAVITLFAVLVALVPIIIEYNRRRKLARNVRARLLAYLRVLKEVGLRCQGKPSIALSDGELKAVTALGSMMSELSVLEQDEHDHLWLLMADIKFLEAYPSTINKINKDSLNAIDELSNKLVKTLEKPGLKKRFTAFWHKKTHRSIPPALAPKPFRPDHTSRDH